jgi:hypothetical protein
MVLSSSFPSSSIATCTQLHPNSESCPWIQIWIKSASLLLPNLVKEKGKKEIKCLVYHHLSTFELDCESLLSLSYIERHPPSFRDVFQMYWWVVNSLEWKNFSLKSEFFLFTMWRQWDDLRDYHKRFVFALQSARASHRRTSVSSIRRPAGHHPPYLQG